MTGKCFVSGCDSGLDSVRRQYKKENKKHPQLFSAPKHWTVLQIWSRIIPTSDKKFSITDRICELHFGKDYVSKFHELNLKDGKVFKLERNFAKLLPGAIPTIFPEFPQYSKNVQKIVDKMRKEFPLHIPEMDLKIDDMESYFKKISEVQKVLISNSEETVDEPERSSFNENVNFENMNAREEDFSDDELDTESRNMSDIEFDVSDDYNDINSEHKDSEAEGEEKNEPDEITFDVLVKNLNSVSKPNSSWSITSHGKFVMCAKWNKEYRPEKRVVIDRDLNIKAFLHDNEIAAYNNCISDIDDISNILCILDK